MGKALLNEHFHDIFGPAEINYTGRNTITARYNPGTSDCNESDCLGPVRFKADGSTGGDIESLSIGFCAIESEGGVCFDKVVVGSDLLDSMIRR